MAEFNQFGSARQNQSADGKQCSHFETMLAEEVDGRLSTEEQAAFDLHLAGCATCREMLADAKRGAAWMEMLREHAPDPPTAMLERILAQTSGAPVVTAGGVAAVGTTQGFTGGLTAGSAGVLDSGLGAAGTGNVLAFRKRAVRGFDFQGLGHTLLQPRLAMTAAMAFFSIALTLNLTGVRLSELRVSDLRPSSLKRSMYEANAHVVRYYTNLRVVYELESRVHDLQRDSDGDSSSAPAAVPETGNGAGGQDKTESGPKGSQQEKVQPRQRVSPGTSRREPMHQGRSVVAEMQGHTWDLGSDRAAGLVAGVRFLSQEGGTA